MKPVNLIIGWVPLKIATTLGHGWPQYTSPLLSRCQENCTNYYSFVTCLFIFCKSYVFWHPSCIVFFWQEEYEKGDKMGTLRCEHHFHPACIKNWLQMKNTCPVCKSEAFEDVSSQNWRGVIRLICGTASLLLLCIGFLHFFAQTFISN